MILNTYNTIVTKLQNDLDLINEVFVSPAELLGYMNEAISDAEKSIHNLGHEDKYFLTTGNISLVNGQQDYSLPADIYGNKIRKIYYVNGSLFYRVDKIRQLDSLLFVQPGDNYQFLLPNLGPNQLKLRLYPTPTESLTNGLVLWYVREANKLTSSTTDANNVSEIPESDNFIYAHVRLSIAKKSKRQDWIQVEAAAREQAYNLMLESLADFTLDENNSVIMDLSSYYDQEMERGY